eukprot:TRINITY_DN13338_c0_g1_i1.p1 TRINITY_DN13338_c0_g1~~TRINITY_DN13338_c0_g1_i1.p1  ORF type:complete len:1024 (-),score=135.47 TRINITY_DN13338_c0_g1_i1:338-3409(-)
MIARWCAAVVLTAAIFENAQAVDRSKFRTCKQGSFCRRFTKWTSRPERDTALWTVLPSTQQILSDGGWSFQLKHVHEDAPHLLLKLNIYAAGMVRLRLDEIDPEHPRYVIPAGDVINDPPPANAQGIKVSQTEDSSTFTFKTGNVVTVVLSHKPISLNVFVDGFHLQSVNARNLLSFERYRSSELSLRPPDAAATLPGADALVIDAAAHPHDLDKDGMWSEDFGGHTDKKPRGPAGLGVDVSFLGDVRGVFGLPEHAAKANLEFFEEPYRFFNLDVFEYEIDEPMGLYGAVPIVWALHRLAKGNTMASGFLWINPSETFVKLERSDGSHAKEGPVHSWFVSESGVMDAVVFVGPAPSQISEQFHAITGSAPLPPLWALGKHQCRWNYMSEKDVASVDAGYEKNDMPYDVVWLDIEHTNGKQYFTWNDANFPTPDKMIQKISDKRRKFVNVVDPHIKKDDNYDVYKEIRDKGLFTKKVNWRTMDDPNSAKPMDWNDVAKILDPNATKPDIWNEEEDGAFEPPLIDNPEYKGEWKPRQITDPASPTSEFEGWCWPGTSLYPDFTNPEMRKYWSSRFALDKYKGTNADTYIWNDMNEPSVFNGPEVTMPRDVLHMRSEGHPSGNVEHRDVHNMYGYYVHRATFEGLEQRVPGDRPFVLTRSFFIGSHKYAAIWTGDNYAKWSHLKASIAMVGALALGGQSLVGADVGGFFKHPDDEMMIRWYQLAVLSYPFLRNHAHLETPRREPHTLEEASMNRVKAALQLRYRMLPLWYTIFHDYHTSGTPVVRPLFFDFLGDFQTHDDEIATEDQIMLGDVVLVHGVTKPLTDYADQKTKVYLPTTSPGWYDLNDGVFFSSGSHEIALSLDRIPAFYQAGKIVPLKTRVRRSSSCMAMDPLTLNVYLNPMTKSAQGRVYLDDYKTKNYQDGKSFLSVNLEFVNNVLRASSTEGDLAADIAAEVERVEIFGLQNPLEKATLTVLDETHALPTPKSRNIGMSTDVSSASKNWGATVKLSSRIDLRKSEAWKLVVA